MILGWPPPKHLLFHVNSVTLQRYHFRRMTKSTQISDYWAFKRNDLPGEEHSSVSTSTGQLSKEELPTQDMSTRVRFFVHAPHSLHCGVKTGQKDIRLRYWGISVSPGLIVSIFNPLMDPAWATYQSLEAKTSTLENCFGSVFSTDHKVSPFILREKKYLEPVFVWPISTTVHSLVEGFFVRNAFPTLGFPLRVVLM